MSELAGPVAADARTKAVRAALALVLLLALYLRAVAAIGTEVQDPIRADAADYVSYAWNLAEHDTYSRTPTWLTGGAPVPDAMRTPGYPLLLLAFLGDAPDPRFVLNVTLFQALLGVLTVLLAFACARRIVGDVGALAVALLLAIAPQVVAADTYLLTEGLFAFALAAAMLALARAAAAATARGTFLAWLAAGALFAFAALVRPTLQYLPLVLVPVMFILLPRERRVRACVALVAGFAATLAPWIVRNELVLGRSGDPTLTIATLHHGSYPGFMYEDRPETLGYPYRFDPRSAAIVADTDSVLAHIRAEFARRPGRMLAWYVLQKPVYFVGWAPIQQATDLFVYPVLRSPYLDRAAFQATHALMRVLHWPLMALALVGLVLAWLPNRRAEDPPGRLLARLYAAVLAYAVLVHVAGAPFPRYSVPFRAWLYLFSLYALVAAWRLARRTPR